MVGSVFYYMLMTLFLLPSLSQTFEEAGHYSLWMRSGLLNDVTCSLTVDRSPNNAYLRKYACCVIKNIK